MEPGPGQQGRVFPQLLDLMGIPRPFTRFLLHKHTSVWNYANYSGIASPDQFNSLLKSERCRAEIHGNRKWSRITTPAVLPPLPLNKHEGHLPRQLMATLRCHYMRLYQQLGIPRSFQKPTSRQG